LELDKRGSKNTGNFVPLLATEFKSLVAIQEFFQTSRLLVVEV
jgi:hypothetical protein